MPVISLKHLRLDIVALGHPSHQQLGIREMSIVYQEGDYEAVHENPIWRERSDFIIVAYLGSKDGNNEWEQLWVLRLDDRNFSLCCIPFFVYDLSLGDEVETDENYVVQRVLKTSDQYTFRIWFGGSAYATIRNEVLQEIKRLSIWFEWSSNNLLAISVNADRAQNVANYLHAQQNTGKLIYETGRTGQQFPERPQTGS